MTAKPYLSFSQLNLYANCAQAYERRYVRGEVRPPGIAALRGRGVHCGAEINHRQKLETGVDLSAQEIVDAAVTAFNESYSRDGLALTKEEESEGAEKVIGKAIDSTARLANLYATEVAPGIDPELVEAKITIELPDSPMDVLGILDVATKDGRIKDIKTAAKSKRQADADDSLQLTLYEMVYQAATGKQCTGTDMEVLVDLKAPKHQRLSTVRTARDYQVLVNRMNTTIKAIQTGIFPPANVGHWMCGPRYCGYWSTCSYVNSDRRSVVNSECK